MKYRRFFIIMLLLVLCSSIAALFTPILLNIWMADHIGFSTVRIAILIIALLLSLAVDLSLTYFRERFAEDFNISNCKNMLMDFFHLSYDEITEQGPTSLIERISIAVNSIYLFMTGDFIKIWSSILVILAVLSMIAVHHPILAAIMLTLVPVNYFGYKALNRELLKRSAKMQEATSTGWQSILSVTNQTDYLKQCSSYENIMEQMTPTLKRIYGSMAEINVFAQLSSKLLASMNQMVQIFIMAVAVYQFMNDNTSPITLVLFSLLMPLYFNNLSVITNANLNKRDMMISLDFLKQWKVKQEKDGSHAISSIHSIDLDISELRIKENIINGSIEGSYHKGDVIWVKGESGSGKSTLVKLLPKFRLADKILINQLDLRDITNYSLRQRMDYLSQNVPIIKGTLRDNLFFNKPYHPAIEQKLKNDPILQSLLKDKTFETEISENGSNLSGGEKQKIAIARALYNDSDVLILDEVTSNIDKESAEAILKRIMVGHENKIIFIISHDDLPKPFANKILQLTA